MGTDDATGSLGDRLQAQDVIVRYAACIDDRDFERYRGCFWPEIESASSRFTTVGAVARSCSGRS